MADYKEYVVRVDKYKTEWFNNKGQYHREGGPAVEYSNGDRFWYKNGEYHREDGPACEYSDGGKSWYKNGNLHREDGPAREYANGHKQWYVNGRQLTEQEFNNRNKKEFSMDEIAKALGVNVSDLKIRKD